MEIRFQNLGPDKWKADCMLALVCEGEKLPEVNPEIDKTCPWLMIAPALRDFHGKKDEVAVFYGHPDLDIPRVIAIGVGRKESVTIDILRKAVAKGTQKARKLGVKSILLPEPVLARLPGGRETILEECVYASLLALYRFTELKTKTENISPNPEWLAVGFDGQTQPDALQAAARRGEMAAETVCLARDLENLPANLLYPEALAFKAVNLAQENGFTCQVLNELALDEAGLKCLLAVGRGSSHPPRLVIIEHAPAGHEQDKPLIFIGKGLTFDSGGLCLKPAKNMDQMKCDMSGAAVVLSVISTLSKEKVQRRIIGILACAENMPDGNAFRPGDVWTAANGENVEVVNTDAEGRLALCDALCYAQKHWTPAAIVDIATLTGACAVALGSQIAGLFCDDDGLAHKLSGCGAAGGENFWRMPLWEPYAEQLKSEIADIKHTAAREGGAITAALFLKHFVAKGSLWAHLDIAGVDWNSKANPLCPIGATGFGCRSLLALGRGGLA